MFNPNTHITIIKTKQGPRDYLPVQWRVCWFRDQCPAGQIDTQLVHLDLDAKVAVFKATIQDAPWRRSVLEHSLPRNSTRNTGSLMLQWIARSQLANIPAPSQLSYSAGLSRRRFFVFASVPNCQPDPPVTHQTPDRTPDRTGKL